MRKLRPYLPSMHSPFKQRNQKQKRNKLPDRIKTSYSRVNRKPKSCVFNMMVELFPRDTSLNLAIEILLIDCYDLSHELGHINGDSSLRCHQKLFSSPKLNFFENFSPSTLTFMGTTPPSSPLPAPNGITGIRCLLHRASTLEI